MIIFEIFLEKWRHYFDIIEKIGMIENPFFPFLETVYSIKNKPRGRGEGGWGDRSK